MMAVVKRTSPTDVRIDLIRVVRVAVASPAAVPIVRVDVTTATDAIPVMVDMTSATPLAAPTHLVAVASVRILMIVTEGTIAAWKIVKTGILATELALTTLTILRISVKRSVAVAALSLTALTDAKVEVTIAMVGVVSAIVPAALRLVAMTIIRIDIMSAGAVTSRHLTAWASVRSGIAMVTDAIEALTVSVTDATMAFDGRYFSPIGRITEGESRDRRHFRFAGLAV